MDKIPREIIIDQLKERLSKDIKFAAREYKSMIRDLQWLADVSREDTTGNAVRSARNILRQIRDFRYFDEQKLMEFGDQIKDMEGQKYVFLFFQKKTVPVPPEFGELDDLNDLVRPVISFNVDRVKQAFSDALISIHFIFVTKTDLYQLDGHRMNPVQGGGMQLMDQSAEIFGAFHEMADATGGTIDSSANIASSFQRAAVASENYYLLYYSPKDYKSDGKFKKIEVKIKGKNYRITHRAGYIAD
jgi:VWFA-related protein